ncbi:MAG TPA: tetratricopeptide repeat protein [Isosphaeraceae bacterium]|jgi:TolA-binding protein|nr:tetratricopeptide repeat protein [Isosphaeraceae bacterium]
MSSPPPPRPPSRRAARLAAALLAVAVLPGCANGLIANWQAAHSDLTKDSTLGNLADDRGFLARTFFPQSRPVSATNNPNVLIGGSNGWKPAKPERDPQAEADFQAAEKLFRQGEFLEAEKGFEKLAKSRKDSFWGEKAQYYLAESQFQRGNFRKSMDGFTKLFSVNAGTRYTDKASQRLYQIGTAWMAYAQPDPGPLPGADGTPTKKDPDVRPVATFQWTDHFNGRLPIVDTGGFAEKALEQVKVWDTEGPLADQAAIRIADYHFANRDYETAATDYKDFIANYPKSRFLRRAQLACIDANMKAYLGPEYDGSGLEQAKQTIEQTRILFPEQQASTEDRLVKVLDVITDENAARAFTTGQFYKSAGNVQGAEYYFAMVPRRWPKSSWAKKAKAELVVLAKTPRGKMFGPSKIMTLPGMQDPSNSNAGIGSNTMSNPMGMMGGAGPPA